MEKYLQHYIFDNPVPYKKLLIHPIQMKDFFFFHFCINAFIQEKNAISDIKIIQMSYLDWIVLEYEKNPDNMFLPMIDWVLRKVLGKRDDYKIFYGKNPKNKFVFSIDDETYDSKDFDEIKKIILEQNMIDVPDELMQKELRDELKKAQEYKQKMNNTKMGTLEDQIICVLISTPLNLEQIKELTIRKFQKILARVDAKLHYEIYLSASMSGFVKFEDKSILAHWMRDLSKDDKFSDVKTDANSVEQKIRSVNGL